MSDTLADRESIHGLPVQSVADLSPARDTLFHTAPREDIDAICKEGIRGDKEKEYRGETEQFIKTVLAEAGCTLPFDRQRTVFCWPTVYAPFATLSDRKVRFEIDFQALEGPVYAADFSHGTEVVCGYEESQILHGVPPAENEELKQHVVDYAESVHRVDTWAEVADAISTFEIAEILVPGRVSTDALRAVGVPSELEAESWLDAEADPVEPRIDQ